MTTTTVNSELKTRAERRCTQCNTPLSRYNTQMVCGPCEVQARCLRPRTPALPPGLWNIPSMRRALTQTDVGEILRIYRQQTGLSRRDLALLLGVRLLEISRIETSPRIINDPSLLARFAECLGIPSRVLAPTLQRHRPFSANRSQRGPLVTSNPSARVSGPFGSSPGYPIRSASPR